LRGDLSFEEARRATAWVAASEQTPDFGFTDDVIWLRLKLRSHTAAPYVFVVDASITDLTAFVITDKVREVRLDVETRMRARTMRYRRPAFRVDLPAGDSEIMFRVQSIHLVQFPLAVWKPDAFEEFRSNEMLLFGSFFGALIAIAIYNLFVFLSTGEQSYRIYIFYVVSTILYQSGFEGFHIQLLSGMSPIVIARASIVFAGFIAMSMNAFARSFLQTKFTVKRFDLLHRILGFCGFLLAIAGAIPQIPYSLIVRPGAYLAGVTLITMFLSGVFVWRTGYKPARYYTIAITLFVVGALVYSGRILGFVPNSFMVQHSTQFGVLAEVLLFSLALSDRINMLQKSLEKNLHELGLAHRTLATSELKYRVLVEDTTDLIFSADPTGKILSMNEAAMRTLGYAPAKMVGQPLFDFVYEGPGDSHGYEALLLRDSLTRLETQPLQFRVRLKSKQGEPIDLGMRLEKIKSGREAIVLGKATTQREDILAQSVRTEHGSYLIENFLTVSDLLLHHITRSLRHYFSDDACDEIRLVLREMLVNAIEHGNLEISFEEKTSAQSEGTYLELIRARQKLSQFRNRKVLVEYSINPKRAWFRITDEGGGFDHIAMKQEESKRLKDMAGTHGRGIGLARQLCDVVEYNGKGNSVTLAKFVRNVPESNQRSP